MGSSRPVTSSLDARIAMHFLSLRPSEQRTAQYFAVHAHELPFMSSSQIAKVLAVSNTTVVRTAQALGYAGLPELRAELRAVIEDRLLDRMGSPRPRTEEGHGFERLIAAYVEILHAAARSISEEALDRSIDMLRRARRVGVFGMAMNATLAEHFGLRLGRSGRIVYLITRSGVGLADDLLQMRKGDVLVAISYSTMPDDDLILTLDRAREREIRSILITDTLVSPPSGHDSVVLSAARQVDGWPSAVVTAVLLEALLFGLATAELSRTKRTLAELTDLQDRIGAQARAGR
jgi:DNA-binding MurR/RpiR family transcriptional regulator